MTSYKSGLILLCLWCTCQLPALASDNGIYSVVKQYTKDNGLPVNAVTDLAIDKDGFLWIATHDGLMQFDGLSFKLFNTNSHSGMPGNQIRMIQPLNDGGLLVLFGVSQLYLFENNKFSQVGEVTLDSFAISNSQLWFGTEQGLFVRDLSTNSTQHIIDDVVVTSLTLNPSGVLYADNHCAIYFYSYQLKTTSTQAQLDCQKVNEMQISDNDIWAVSTNNGVFVARDDIKQYLPDQQILKLSWVQDRLYTLSAALHLIEADGTILELSRPKENIIYLDPPARVTDSGEVWVNAFTSLWLDNEIAFNSPSSIFKHILDQQGGLWVATKGDGLLYLRKPVIETLGLEENQLNSGFVTSIDRAENGYYLAAEGSALYRFKPNEPEWYKYESITMVRTFLHDSTGNIWVASKGLCKMDSRDNCIKQPYPVSAFSNVQLLFEDSEGQIWVGSDEGLFTYKNDQWQLLDSHNSQYVFATEVPGEGVFLASLHHGISVFKNNKKVQQIDDNDGLPTNRIRTFYYDAKLLESAILIGTEDKGLCFWHFDNGLVRCANESEGLPHYGIHHILPDKNNRLWFSSNKGIYAIRNNNIIDYFKHKINFLPSHRFGKSDGMAESEANGGVQASGTIGYQGDLWFPTQKGIVRVPANELVIEETPLTAYFKEILVSGKQQTGLQPIIIDDPNHRELTLSLSTIALGLADGIRFRYRLKPTDPWNELEQAQEISFNALPAGHHVLSFQVARYGHWIGPETQLMVIVKPTIMETIWFRIGLFTLVVMSLFWWIHKLRKRKDILEIEVSKRTAQLSSALKTISSQNEKIKNTAERKQQHFLELSHELRTPLTLILGPLHSDSTINADTQKMMARNADSLLHLINQMLELEQLDVFDEELTFSTISLAVKCRLGLDKFKHEFDKRSIKVEFNNPDYDVNIAGVDQQIDTLLINLLSNAVKFTPNAGTIRITIKANDNDQGSIFFEDSGPGIPPEKRAQIFNRFVRLNHQTTEGNGLGLAIVKRIVQHHQGSINVEDSDLGGVKFVISFPLAKQLPLKETNHVQTPSSKRSILVVDDNADILALTNSILSTKYQVYTTQYPEEGLKMAIRMVPDLIIVDIGMPKINGFELVTSIRKYTDTKNIPVIFATARAHPSDQVKALETGGDAFITKPFTAAQLLAYVNRLLTTKNHDSTTAIPDTSGQKILLTRAKEIIHQAITDTDFGVEQLAAELAMSRSALYRKFKHEVNFSPAEYISRCRMERAGELLLETTLSVAKVAQMTGFKQVSTFTRSFQRYYGHNPTEHRNR